jgi:hypothetical protein
MSGRAGRGAVWLRLLAVAAFAGTAAAAVVLNRLPPHRAAPRSSGACAPSALTTSIGSAAGLNLHGRYYTLQFRNTSSQPCSLYGYPAVSPYSGPQPAGSTATLDYSMRPRPVTLAPGASAQSVLEYRGTDGYRPDQCRRVTATELRVWLPRQPRATMVPFSQPVCSRRGPRVFTVQPIQPKPAITGVSRM